MSRRLLLFRDPATPYFTSWLSLVATLLAVVPFTILCIAVVIFCKLSNHNSNQTTTHNPHSI